MTEIDMKGNPFFLDEEGENWVLDTWKNMSLEQKCGQVFCPMGFNGEEETLKHFTQDIQVGGLMYRADSAENIQDIYRKLQAFSNILRYLRLIRKQAETDLPMRELPSENLWQWRLQMIRKMDTEWDIPPQRGCSFGAELVFCAYCGY